MLHEHINMLGRYSLSVLDAMAQGELPNAQSGERRAGRESGRHPGFPFPTSPLGLASTSYIFFLRPGDSKNIAPTAPTAPIAHNTRAVVLPENPTA